MTKAPDSLTADGNLPTKSVLADLFEAQAAEIKRLRGERERLALAICGGEDAPGYANAQTVETLERVARDNANATMEQINRTLAVEAKLAKAVEALEEIATDEHPLGWIAIAALAEIKGAKP